MIGYAVGISSCYAATTSPAYGLTYDCPVMYTLLNNSTSPVQTFLCTTKVDASSSSPFTFDNAVNLTALFGPFFEQGGMRYERVGGDENGCWVQVGPATLNAANQSQLPYLAFFDKDLAFKRLIGLRATDDIRVSGPGFYDCARLSQGTGGTLDRLYCQFVKLRNPSGNGVAEFYQQIFEVSGLQQQSTVQTATLFGTAFDIVDTPHFAVSDYAGQFANNNHGLLLGDGAVVHAFSGTRRAVIPGGAVSSTFPIPTFTGAATWGGVGLRWYKYEQDGFVNSVPLNPRIELTDLMFTPQHGAYGLTEVKAALGFSSQPNFRLLAIGGI